MTLADEASPHMHVVGVPVGRGFKNGPETKVSKRSVFTKETLSVVLQDKLREEANYYMKRVFRQSIQEKSKGRNYDLSVAEYKLQQTEAKFREAKRYTEEQQERSNSLDAQIEEKEQELAEKRKKKEEVNISIEKKKAKNAELQEETDRIVNYANARVSALSVEEKEISKNVNDLKKQKIRLEDRILEIEGSSKEVADRMWIYENGVEYRLEEPDMFMSAKGYKEKVVEPLRKKLLGAIKGLLGKLQGLEIKYRRLKEENEIISENAMELRKLLKERDRELAVYVAKADNLDVLRKYLGEEKLEKMVKTAKEYVLFEEERKRLNEEYWWRKR